LLNNKLGEIQLQKNITQFVVGYRHFFERTAEGIPADVTFGAKLAILSEENGKAIPVAGRGGPQGYETSRLTHFVDNQLIVGGEVVSLRRRPPFTPRKIPGTHFC
jgi:hypothetical protein